MRNIIEKYLHLALPILATTLAIVSAYAERPLIEQGRAAINRGDSDAAIAILEKAVAQDPNSAEAHFCLFEAYGSKAQEVGMLRAAKYGPKAKAEGEKAVALNPKHAEARLGLVQVYMMTPGFMGGSANKALEQAKEIKAIDPVLGHRAYAFIYSQQKKPEQAKKEYLDAIRERPDSAKARSYFGTYLAKIENYSAAFPEFETALKLDANYMPPLYHLGRVAALANTNLARGEEALKRYLAYSPKENEPTLANANYQLGAVYEKEGKKWKRSRATRRR